MGEWVVWVVWESEVNRERGVVSLLTGRWVPTWPDSISFTSYRKTLWYTLSETYAFSKHVEAIFIAHITYHPPTHTHTHTNPCAIRLTSLQ